MADEKKRLATLTEAEVDLQKKLMTPFIYIKYIILPFPQTICGSKTCTEMRIDPNGTPYLFNKVSHNLNIFSQYSNLVYLSWCLLRWWTNWEPKPVLKSTASIVHDIQRIKNEMQCKYTKWRINFGLRFNLALFIIITHQGLK